VDRGCSPRVVCDVQYSTFTHRCQRIVYTDYIARVKIRCDKIQRLNLPVHDRTQGMRIKGCLFKGYFFRSVPDSRCTCRLQGVSTNANVKNLILILLRNVHILVEACTKYRIPAIMACAVHAQAHKQREILVLEATTKPLRERPLHSFATSYRWKYYLGEM